MATGLMAALRGRGLQVSPHKVGPDYIDPGWHAVATGRPGRSLDPVLQGPGRVVPLLLHGASTPRPADVAVLEGVMGLFDGATGRDGEGSTAHVARLTSSPVVLVVDAARAARSVGALVHGFTTFEPGTRVAAVVLNRVGSARHEAELRRAVESAGVPVVGALRRDERVQVPSRHLGLVTAAEQDRAAEHVAAMAELVESGVDVAAVLDVARGAPDLAGAPWDPHEEPPGCDPARDRSRTARPVVAVLTGPAFTFAYPEHTELLHAAGADVVHVDPLRDAVLPAGVAGLVIGGGFPEVHAEALSANASLRAAVAEAVRDGVPTVAECAGLLYLARSLDGHPMCGALPVEARMTGRLTLGYRDAVALGDSPLLLAGARVTGHEFHRTACDPPAGWGQVTGPAWRWAVDGVVAAPEGFAGATLHASYLHLHWAGRPQAAHRFVDRARAHRSRLAVTR
ncbi:cobyrinate a,c-diamide synthase [Thalassiella azotivora]